MVAQNWMRRDARLPVYLNNEQSQSLDEKVWLKRLEDLHAACNLGPLDEWGVTWVDEAAIHDLNREYRGVDKPTDVLAFALEDVPGEAGEEAPRLLGDVVVAVDVANEQARARGHDLDAELALLSVHGLLHLLGEDHDTPQRQSKMWARQIELLRVLGFEGPTLIAPEGLELPGRERPSAGRRRRGSR